MAYVWGADGTDKTPLFNRIGSNVLWTLYENQATLLESEFLIDRTNKRVRSEMSEASLLLAKNHPDEHINYESCLRL